MKINFTRKFVPAAQTLQILRKAWLINMRILSEALGYVKYFCFYLVHNYGLAIILFTLISKIVLLMLDSLNKRLADRQLKVELTDAAMNAVIDQGFDPVYGARPLKRFIQSKIETLVAKHIIAADVKPCDTLTIDVNENGELYMRW